MHFAIVSALVSALASALLHAEHVSYTYVLQRMHRLSVLMRSALRVHGACTPLPRSYRVVNANHRYPQL